MHYRVFEYNDGHGYVRYYAQYTRNQRLIHWRTLHYSNGNLACFETPEAAQAYVRAKGRGFFMVWHQEFMQWSQEVRQLQKPDNTDKEAFLYQERV